MHVTNKASPLSAGHVVMFKGALGALATWLLAFVFGKPWPALWPALAQLLVGATGYGLSLRFYLLAQRACSAARTGSVFALAPFIGAAQAYQPVEHEHAHTHDDGHHSHVDALMPAGPHSHLHRHEPQRHSHAHVPDEHHVHRH